MRARGDDFVAFRGQHAGGGRIHLGEKDALHAAQQHGHAPAALADLRGEFRHLRRGPQIREKRFHRTQPLGEEFQDAELVRQLPQAGFLIELQRQEHGAQARRIGKGFEDELAEAPLRGRALVVAFNLRARGFNQFAVVHAGGAGGHARHAAQAGVEMAHPFVVQRSRAGGRHVHQVDASARRIHLIAPEEVGGTNRQAEAAVHAFVQNFARRGMVRVKGAFRSWRKRPSVLAHDAH